MENYKDLDGDSGVAAFEIGADSITVEFKGGALYLYNYASAGAAIIEQMKTLAKAGNGLNSYIMKNARTKYAKKLN